MFAHRLRRWANISQALSQGVVFEGHPLIYIHVNIDNEC